MRIVALALLSGVAVAGHAPAALADLLIKVNQSTQRMIVEADGRRIHEWTVSTGRPGFETPNGTFRPNRMVEDHRSQEYDDAPMPHAIFFDLKGRAFHGSTEPIGRPAASHGCIRLAPENAEALFALVKEHRMAKTKIEIEGDVQIALRNSKPAKVKTAASRQRSRDRGADYGVATGPRRVYVYEIREPGLFESGPFGLY